MLRPGSMPKGALAVGGGLVANGALTYAFLAFASQTLDERSYSALAVVWVLVSLLGSGIFQPLEQELARATAHRAVLGQGSLPIVRTSLTIGVVVVVVTGVVASLAWTLGFGALVDRHVGLLVATVAALAGFMLTEVVRGLVAGQQRFGAYGRSLAIEGTTRFGGALALTWIGYDQVGAFGVIVAASFYAAALGGFTGPSTFAVEGPPAALRELFPNLGRLLAMASSEAFLLNIGPVAVAALSDADGDPGRFLNGLVIARLPLFLFQAIKISMLPAHVGLAAAGRYADLRRSTITLLAVVGAFGGATTIGAAALGPWAVSVLFGDELRSIDMLLLGLASLLAMVTIVLSLTLLSIDRAPAAVAGWVIGVACFFVTLGLPVDVLIRVGLSINVAFVVAGSLMAVSTARALAELMAPAYHPPSAGGRD